MVDVHCHLNLHKFDEDYDIVINRAVEAGVTTIVNTGTSIESSKRAVALARKYKNLYAIVGIHPHHADKISLNSKSEALNPKPFNKVQGRQIKNSNDKNTKTLESGEEWIKQLEGLSRHKKVIGIGEVGMDYFSYKSNGVVNKKTQEDVFRAQIELSIKLSLPLQIHNRQAGEDVLGILNDYKNRLQAPPGMFHCFAGSFEVLKNALDMGFYIGFDGNITYKGVARGETVELNELALKTPLERLLIETDSPFLTPIPLRGERNTPKNAIIIGKYLSSLKKISYSELEEQVNKNFEAVFKVHII